VYGDGRIVWVEVTRGPRTVYEGVLTREQMTALLARISDAGFFGWESLYGPVNEVMDAGTTVLAVNLTSGRTQVAEYFEGAPPKFHELDDKLHAQGGDLLLAGVHENVQTLLRRAGLLEEIGEHNLFWSSDQAILAAEERPCNFCKGA